MEYLFTLFATFADRLKAMNETPFNIASDMIIFQGFSPFTCTLKRPTAEHIFHQNNAVHVIRKFKFFENDNFAFDVNFISFFFFFFCQWSKWYPVVLIVSRVGNLVSQFNYLVIRRLTILSGCLSDPRIYRRLKYREGVTQIVDLWWGGFVLTTRPSI